MFDQLKNMKNLAGMLGNAQEMKEQFERVQAELARKTVEADAGAGAVRVVVNGKLEVKEVRFDQPLLTSLVGEGSEADREMVEELIVAATNAALVKAQDLVREEIGKATGGLNLPGLGGLLD